eukprot:206530_1
MAQEMLEIIGQEENKMEAPESSTFAGEIKCKESTEIIYENTPLPAKNENNMDEDDLADPFDGQKSYRLFYFGGGHHEKVFYELSDSSSNSHGVYECQCLNIQQPLPWPERIYLTEQQLKTVSFIKPGSETAKSAFNHYNLHGLKKGYVFYFEVHDTHKRRPSDVEAKYDDQITFTERRLVYIIDDVIESKRGDHTYQCTNIISSDDTSFPGRVYLTKHQFNGLNQLLGLDLLKKRAIYIGQQVKSQKSELDEGDEPEIDTENAQLKVLREEKLNWYFCIYYEDKSQRIVYYVSEIENVDHFVCTLSKKNGLNELEADIPDSRFVLNKQEMDELEQNDHAFDGTGCLLHFEEDIYSFYASFYMSRTHTQSWPLLAVTVCTYILQAASIFAIGWCFDVAYTEDVLKYYTITELEQCGVEITLTADEEPSNDTELWSNSTSFCLSLNPNASVPNSTSAYFSLVEANGATQEFVEPQSWWYIIGYTFTAFASLLILTFYVYKNAVGPIKLYVSLAYCDNIEKSAQTKVRRIAFLTQGITIFAYGLSIWSIVTYTVGQGISDPFGVLALPISVVFILELDDWAYSIVQIGYTAYTQSSYGIEITKNALADFGSKAGDYARMFVYVQMLTCMISMSVAMGSGIDNSDWISDDVWEVFWQIIQGVWVFTLILFGGFIWSYGAKVSLQYKVIYTCFIGFIMAIVFLDV